MTVQLPPAATVEFTWHVPPEMDAPIRLPRVACRLRAVMVCGLAFGLEKVHVVPDGPETVNGTAVAALRDALAAAVLPAALAAVTVHVAVPALLVPTLIDPLVPEPVAVAPAPEQLTVAELALAVVQLKVLLLPAVTLDGLNEALLTLGAA